MTRVLLDTNVLVYAYDQNDPAKALRAREILAGLYAAGRGCLSAQVLAEFVSTATRKLRLPLTPEQARQQVEAFSGVFPVFDLTVAVVLEAVRGRRDHRLAYYDARAWAAARLNQAAVIFSEGFPAAATLDGGRFVNPFAPDLNPVQWW